MREVGPARIVEFIVYCLLFFGIPFSAGWYLAGVVASWMELEGQARVFCYILCIFVTMQIWVIIFHIWHYKKGRK